MDDHRSSPVFRLKPGLKRHAFRLAVRIGWLLENGSQPFPINIQGNGDKIGALGDLIDRTLRKGDAAAADGLFSLWLSLLPPIGAHPMRNSSCLLCALWYSLAEAFPEEAAEARRQVLVLAHPGRKKDWLMSGVVWNPVVRKSDER